MKIYSAFPPEGRELVQPIGGWEWSKSLNGVPRKASWTPIAVRVVSRGGKVRRRSSCPYFGLTHALVFREDAILKLGPFLCACGEILPLKSDEEPLFLWHPLTVIDVLDIDTSEVWRSRAGRLLDVRRFSFHRDKLQNHAAFKIPDLAVCPILYSESAVARITEAIGGDLQFKLQWSDS